MNKIVLFPPLEHFSSPTKHSLNNSDFFDENGSIRNGLGIITPTSCTCSRELRGCFELSLEVRDPDKRIEPHLKEWVHIAAPILGRWDDSGEVKPKYQIFYITEVQRTEGENGSVTYALQAKHMFYNLLYYKSGGASPTNTTCSDVMQNLILSGNCHDYNFTSSSDCDDVRYVPMLPTDATNAALILDEGNLLDMFGCELHRDNFEINLSKSRKKYSQGSAFAPAFRFIIGKEISNINEITSYPDSMTGTAYVVEQEETGEIIRYTIKVPSSKVGTPIGTFGEPVRYTMGKNEFENISESLADARFKAEQLLKRKAFPENSCVVTLADIRNSDTYKNIENVALCDIGDVGIVYSPSTKKSCTQICTRTVEDVLKGCYTEITLGTISGSIAKNYDNSSYIGMQKYFSSTEHMGGFTAKVTVSAGKTKVRTLSRYMFELSDLSFDADVNYGDSYIHTLSSAPDEGDIHEYAYAGEYTLSYTSYFSDIDYPHRVYPFESAVSDILNAPITQTAVMNAGKDGFADVDDIVFMDGTTKIGQTLSEEEKVAITGGKSFTKGIFNDCPSITKITIPHSTKYVSSLFIRNCLNVKGIVYGGTLAEWSALLQLSHEWDVRFGGQFKSDLFDMYNVTVVCTDGSTVWHGELGVNPKYGV